MIAVVSFSRIIEDKSLLRPDPKLHPQAERQFSDGAGVGSAVGANGYDEQEYKSISF